MPVGSETQNLSLLSRGIGNVFVDDKNAESKIMVQLEPEDYRNFTNVNFPRKRETTEYDLHRRAKTQKRMYMPKTFITRRGALFLFSEDQSEALGIEAHEGAVTIRKRPNLPGTHRAEQDRLTHRSRVTANHLPNSQFKNSSSRQTDDLPMTGKVKENEEPHLKTMDDLARSILIYGGKNGGGACFNISQLTRPTANTKMIRPGFSARRYLSNLTKNMDEKLIDRFIKTGRLCESSIYQDHDFLPNVKRRINDDLSHYPTPYRIMKKMLISPGSLTQFSFVWSKKKKTPVESSASSEIEKFSRNNTEVEFTEGDIVLVKHNQADLTKPPEVVVYKNLNPEEKQQVLSNLLVKTAITNVLKQHDREVSRPKSQEKPPTVSEPVLMNFPMQHTSQMISAVKDLVDEDTAAHVHLLPGESAEDHHLPQINDGPLVSAPISESDQQSDYWPEAEDNIQLSLRPKRSVVKSKGKTLPESDPNSEKSAPVHLNTFDFENFPETTENQNSSQSKQNIKHMKPSAPRMVREGDIDASLSFDIFNYVSPPQEHRLEDIIFRDSQTSRPFQRSFKRNRGFSFGIPEQSEESESDFDLANIDRKYVRRRPHQRTRKMKSTTSEEVENAQKDMVNVLESQAKNIAEEILEREGGGEDLVNDVKQAIQQIVNQKERTRTSLELQRPSNELPLNPSPISAPNIQEILKELQAASVESDMPTMPEEYKEMITDIIKSAMQNESGESLPADAELDPEILTAIIEGGRIGINQIETIIDPESGTTSIRLKSQTSYTSKSQQVYKTRSQRVSKFLEEKSIDPGSDLGRTILKMQETGNTVDVSELIESGCLEPDSDLAQEIETFQTEEEKRIPTIGQDSDLSAMLSNIGARGSMDLTNLLQTGQIDANSELGRIIALANDSDVDIKTADDLENLLAATFSQSGDNAAPNEQQIDPAALSNLLGRGGPSTRRGSDISKLLGKFAKPAVEKTALSTAVEGDKDLKGSSLKEPSTQMPQAQSANDSDVAATSKAKRKRPEKVAIKFLAGPEEDKEDSSSETKTATPPNRSGSSEHGGSNGIPATVRKISREHSKVSMKSEKERFVVGKVEDKNNLKRLLNKPEDMAKEKLDKHKSQPLESTYKTPKPAGKELPKLKKKEPLKKEKKESKVKDAPQKKEATPPITKQTKEEKIQEEEPKSASEHEDVESEEEVLAEIEEEAECIEEGDEEADLNEVEESTVVEEDTGDPEADARRKKEEREKRLQEREAQRRYDAERKRRETEDKRKQKEEEKRRLAEEQAAAEANKRELDAELEAERLRRAEEFRLKKERKAAEEADRERAELEEEERKQRALERAEREKEMMRRKMEQIKMQREEELARRREEERRRKEEEAERRRLEEEMLAQMGAEERENYLRLKAEEEERRRVEEEELRIRREREAQLSMQEARRLAIEMERSKRRLAARLAFVSRLLVERTGFDHTLNITPAFVWSYFDMLAFLGLTVPPGGLGAVRLDYKPPPANEIPETAVNE